MNPLPPDRDTDLRHAISLDADQQIQVIRHMFGDTAPPAKRTQTAHRSANRRKSAFTHVGADIGDPTPAGGFRYRPHRIDLPIVNSQATELHFQVTYERIERSQTPRAQTEIARLQKHIAVGLPYRGIHRVPLRTPPGQWTIAHIDWVTRLMASYLPPVESDRRQTIDLTTYNWSDLQLIISRVGDNHGFRVACVLSRMGLSQAIEDFHIRPGHGSLTLGDEPLALIPEPLAGTVPPAVLPRRGTRRKEEEDEDDDLTDIERACRQRLHGDRDVPPSSVGADRNDPRHLSLVFAELYVRCRKDPVAADQVARMIEEYLRNRGRGR